jgi:hypothetical protein
MPGARGGAGPTKRKQEAELLFGPRRLEKVGRRLPGATLFLLVALPSLVLVAPAALCAERSLPHPIVFCQLPVEETVELEARAGGMLRADYGNAGRLIVLEPDGTSRNLVPDFYSACDPDVSFDGEKILFAGKRRPSDPWNIWEIDTGGSDLRQVTREQHDSRAPIYLSTLYTITSTEPWYTILFVRDDGVLNEEGSAPGTSLYSVRLDGSEQSRITFNLSNEGDPFLMPDGLVLFAGWQHRVRKGWPRGRISLFGVHTDGIDYSLFGGGHAAHPASPPHLSTTHRSRGGALSLALAIGGWELSGVAATGRRIGNPRHLPVGYRRWSSGPALRRSRQP